MDRLLGGGYNKAVEQGESAGDADTIIGGAGNDRIDAGKSMAEVTADAGNDYISWVYNADTSGGGSEPSTSGGAGEDTISIVLSPMTTTSICVRTRRTCLQS